MKFLPTDRRSGELRSALWALRHEVAVVGMLSMVINLLMLVPTVYMLQIYDRVLVSRNEMTLLALSLLTLCAFGVAAFLEWSRSRILVSAGAHLDRQLTSRVFDASFEASLDPSMSSPQQPLADFNEFRQFLTGLGVFAFFDALWTPVYIVVLFLLHPILGFVAIGFAVLQGLLAWLGHQQLLAPARTQSLALANANATLHKQLREADVVDSMGMFGGLLARWQVQHRAYMAQHAVTQELAHRVASWTKFVRYSQQSLALAVGALLVITDQLSPGAMIAANVLMSRALTPIDQLVGSWRSWISAFAAFQRMEKLLATHPLRASDAAASSALQGGVALQDVVARAAGRAEPILKAVNVQADPGTVTVVLGASGSGKSTLARVMMGVWPDVQGAVLLDGRPVAQWVRAELGPHVGYLPQDVEMLNGSVAENIARFAHVDSAKVIAAAKSTGLHQMILRLPKGYDTQVGEGGSLLSGGLLQRIGLARAIYGNPALVVLDEPNANLDEAGELALLDTVRQLKTQRKTVFLITHRPGVLALADQVLVLRDGHIAFAGPRQDAMASSLLN